MKPRSGSALLELVTSLTLLALLLALCAGLVRSQSVLVRSISERAAASEAVRTARLVLRAESQDLAISDVRAIAADSFAARIFRAWGIVCSIDSTRTMMRYHGMREPEADKDSLLLVGSERAVAFEEAAPSPDPCATLPGETLVAVRPARALRMNTVVLLFESGAYHLSTRALRYRRGLEGRQPITDELFDDGASSFGPERDRRGLLLRIAPRVNGVPVRGGESRIAFRNRWP